MNAGSKISNTHRNRILFLTILLTTMISAFSQQTPASPANQNNVKQADLIGIIGNMLHKNGPPRTDSLVPGIRNISSANDR